MSGEEWSIETLEGSARDLHLADVPPRRLLRVNRVTRPALVLGSRRSIDSADPSGEFEVVTRRSGGGAVWLSPHDQVWIDIVIPKGDPHHLDDVRHAAVLVGRAWLSALGIAGATVWTAGLSEPRLSAVACFAGVGPGEVMLGERKLVGVSQRRTLAWSRFQCVVYTRWDPDATIAALGLGESGPAPRHGAELLDSAERSRLVRALRERVDALGTRPTGSSGRSWADDTTLELDLAHALSDALS